MHHHPHRSVTAWSGALLFADSSNVNRSHKSESVERIISPSNRASGGQHSFGCPRCLRLLDRGSCLHPANGVGCCQLVIASNVLAIPVATWDVFFFALPWLGWTRRETMTQIMREIVKLSFMWRFRPLCSFALRDKVYAHHGVVNTLPTRGHALSHAIFHLGVAGLDLSKHLMKGLHLTIVTARDVKEILSRGLKLRYRSEFCVGKF